MNADTFVGWAMIVASLIALALAARGRWFVYITYENTDTGREYAWVAGNRARARRHLLHAGVELVPASSRHTYEVQRRVRTY